MNQWVDRVILWIWRAWPAIIPATLGFLHWECLDLFPSSAVGINKTIALFMPIVGGLVVLYTLDSSIGILQGKSLTAKLFKYLGDFPGLRKPHQHTLNASSAIHVATNSKMKLVKKPATLEEKVEYLQAQLQDLEQAIQDQKKQFDERLEHLNRDLHARLHSHRQEIAGLTTQVENIVVGGMKPQLMGVLFVVHGAIAGYLA